MTGSEKLIASIEGYFGEFRTVIVKGECLKWLEERELSPAIFGAMYNNLISRHQIRYGNPVGLVEMIESAGIARDQVTLAAPLQVFLPEPEAVPRESREAAEEFKKVFATLQRAKKPPAKTLTERENDLADQAKFLISREDVKN